jgi:hypothetical protein
LFLDQFNRLSISHTIDLHVFLIADFVKQNEHKFQPPQKFGEELPLQEN